MGFEGAFKRNIDTIRNDVRVADANASQESLEKLSERLSELAKKAETDGLTDQEKADQGGLIAEMEKQAKLKANSSDIV
jgi:hypothetical protein